MMTIALLVVVMAAACTATALPAVVDHTVADSDAVGVRKLLQENAINTTDENQVASAGASVLNLTSASRVDWPGCTPTGFIFNARFPAANSPWKVEYNQPYSSTMRNAEWNVCATKNYTYMAALSWRDYGGTPVVELGAAGETAVMTALSAVTAGRCSTQYHRGFYVYNCVQNGRGRSFGFAGNSNIDLNTADTASNNETYRLSWHSSINVGGWRSGTTMGLNRNTQWKKAIICSNTCSPMSPPPPPAPPSPPPPTVGDAIKNATDAVKDTIDKAKDAAGAAGNAAGAAGDVPKTGVADLKDESVTVTLGSSARVYHSLVACVGTLMLWALAA